MSKNHYIIEAKGKETISNQKITIEKYTYIEKNRRVLDKNNHYREKGSNSSLGGVDSFYVLLQTISCLLIVITILSLAYLNYHYGIDVINISNNIGGIGLGFAIVSTKTVRSYYEKCFVYVPPIMKKWFLFILVLATPFFLGGLFSFVGIEKNVSDYISLFAILLTVFSY